MKTLNYKITGTVCTGFVDDNDNDDENMYVCCFKNLSKNGCKVFVKNLSGEPWNDMSVKVHYLITE